MRLAIRRSPLSLAAAALVLAPAGAAAQTATLPEVDIPFERFVLPNGLTVIVHEDHKAPIVAVNLWYHVGSKNERPGRTGFAHLFEHLMFNGSENSDGEYFDVLEQIGATELNGTTWFDRTNYFQNVPTNALDVALWMESDRMGHLLGAITQEKLDEQRGVVQNEKRQGENQPYGRVYDLMLPSIYPAGHPYSWETIGSMEDLNAATVEDVKEWFGEYYGAANAVLVLAGDIDARTAREKAERYFGDIPAGPPIAEHDVWIAKRSGEQRQVLQDRVPQARVYKVWNVPQWGSAEADELELIARVLSEGKTSRLFRRLVYDDQLATSVSASMSAFEIAGQFDITATARPGVDLRRVEAAIDEELARLLREGPTAEEVERVKTGYFADFVRSTEGIGGFGGKSSILAENEVYGGDAGYFRETLRRIRSATPEALHATARKWLSDGVYVMEVHPFAEYTAAEQGADRSRLPEVGAPPTASFPAMEKATLSNGLKVVLANRSAAPLVEMRLMLDAGYAADQFAAPGTAALAMAMLDEGTRTRSALQISEDLARLGAELGTGADLDLSLVTLSALKANVAGSVELLADVVLNPSFPAADFGRLQQEQLARIQREKVTPTQMALRVFPALLYGEGHAYANPLTGSGTEASVSALTREDLVRFHETWFRPNNATLVVVGDVTMAELRPLLESSFREWRPGEVPRKNVGTVAHRPAASVYLVDRPGSQQSLIFAGHVVPPKGNAQEVAFETMNNILGGQFTSRINMNLREDKGWSYGAFSFAWDARGQRPFIAYAPVQSDRTKESVQELAKELRAILAERPITGEELRLAQNQATLTLPGQWERNAAVAGSIAQLVRFGLPDDHFTTYPGRVRALSVADVQAQARETIRPDALVWVIVGDRARIEPGIRELGLGEIHLIDADGRPAGARGTSQ